jgi:4-amino-4-deoxy-L-arabinose transferase-like glycosyltransferase
MFSRLKTHKWDILILIFITMVASWLRLWKLEELPFGFHNDEVMNVYVGRFVIENGFDLYGNPWPILYFNNFGDFPNIIPMYISGASSWLLGNSQFAARLPIALAGIGAVGVTYLICRWLFKRKLPAVMAALSLAVMPWHIVFSRSTAEGALGGFFMLLGFSLVFVGLYRRNWKLYGVGIIGLLFTYLIYHSFRLVVPVGLLVLPFLKSKGVKTPKQWRWVTILTPIIFISLTVGMTMTFWGRGRFEQTSVFHHNDVIKSRQWGYIAGLGEGRVLEARIWHNKYVLAGQEVVRQYLSYFSPEFWFSATAKPERYQVPEHGQLQFSVVLIVALAILGQWVSPLTKKKMRAVTRSGRWGYALAFLWLLTVSPLAAAFTLENVPNTHRTAHMTGFWAITVGLATALLVSQHQQLKCNDICAFWGKWLKKMGSKVRWFWALMAMLVVMMGFETVRFWHYFDSLSRLTTTIYRNEELRTLADWLIENASKYDRVYVPNTPNQALFYLYRANRFEASLAGRFEGNLHLPTVDNIVFMESPCTDMELFEKEVGDEEVVMVNRIECIYPKETLGWFEQIGTLKYSDEKDIFKILKWNSETVDWGKYE